MFVGFQYRHKDDSRITQQNREVILNFFAISKKETNLFECQQI